MTMQNGETSPVAPRPAPEPSTRSAVSGIVAELATAFPPGPITLQRAGPMGLQTGTQQQVAKLERPDQSCTVATLTKVAGAVGARVLVEIEPRPGRSHGVAGERSPGHDGLHEWSGERRG